MDPNTILYIRASQLQPTGGPHNSLRTSLKAARVYTIYGKRGGGEVTELLEGSNLQTKRYAKITAECQDSLINSIKYKEILVYCVLP
jgi:hypothetical protein